MSNDENSQQSFDVADGDCASPRVTEESAPNENKNKRKPKAVKKVKKRRAFNSKPRPYPLQGLHVYLDYDGVKTLGSVCLYDYRKKLFKVEFMLEGKPRRYAEEEEILRNKATPEQVMAHNAGCVNASKVKEEPCASKVKEEPCASRKRSTPASEEASSSQQKKKTH
ncbi:unnamed protein product [Lupinus luteus]|uniref:Uncharacterized protein n=1 Tax=Lupinus luteus TaxID=3873 RepID=A0AAV1XG49_LUPLU